MCAFGPISGLRAHGMASPMGDYMPIVEPLLITPRRGEPFRTAHAWRQGSSYVACGKRVGAGWIVHAVAWSAEPSHEYARCPDCIVALKRR
jgi:hypothetical protein